VTLGADLHVESLGQGVDHRDADAVQTAGDRVGLVVELSTRVQHGQDDLDRRPVLAGDDAYGNASAVVHNSHTVVCEQRDLDPVGVSCQGLVDGVVHNLVNKVVETTLSGRTDVHAWALTDRLKPFENGD
jgi:hypothetical protein